MKKKIIILLPKSDNENLVNNFCYNLSTTKFDLKIYKIIDNKINISINRLLIELILFFEKKLNKSPLLKLNKIKINYIDNFNMIFNGKNNFCDIFINLTENKMTIKQRKLLKSVYLSTACFNKNFFSSMGIGAVMNSDDYTYFSSQIIKLDGSKCYSNSSMATLNSFYLNKTELIQNSLFQLLNIIENLNLKRFILDKNRNIIESKINYMKLVYFIFKKIINRLYKKEYTWSIYFKLNKSKNYLKNFNFKKIIKITNIPGKYLADPFLFKNNDRNYLFAEEYDIKSKIGCIVAYQLSLYSGTYIRLGKILSEKFHLSFPYIFRDKEKIYMIPETSENNDIRLYECIKFPYDWKLKKILIKNIKAVDTIVFKKNNFWWLITATANGKSNQFIKFNVFYSYNGFLGNKWIEMKNSNSYLNEEKSRNGGFIKYKDSIFRVNQKSSFNNYGNKIQINQIVNIDTNDYREKIKKNISVKNLGASNIRGIHHLSFNDDFTAFDLKS